MSRLILHIDLDAFYAAVEQRDHPEWRGRPVVVGAEPGQRGVVATCSYEARRFGVHSTMPIAQAVRRLPPETVYVRPSMARYAKVSQQVMGVLETVSPVVERVSIDEAYLDVSGLTSLVGPPAVIGAQVKERIRHAVGLTASVGIGPNRLIAKLASDAQKPDGLTVVPPEQIGGFLAPMPFTVLRGIGVKTAPRLERLGVKTIGDVRQLPLETLRHHLGARTGTQVYQQARGLADDRIDPDRPRRSISREMTFPEDVSDPRMLEKTLRWAAQEVGSIARQTQHLGRVVTLKIRFHPFETHTRSRTLEVPTADDVALFGAAWSLFAAEPWSGRPVRLIGLGISGWSATDGGVQRDLFETAAPEPCPEHDRLAATLDAIRNRFGADDIQRGLNRRSPGSGSARRRSRYSHRT
ncbi:DNA polymerase IV [Thiorhodococcus minor]|uniref:DNA polymerase IV n=2 Tax=Thiorhodococcus minor TaxID=57489 RepID=A0A6M0K6S3_9GAMM|nr:DNA polymerase IV [Thiorhodococcus minor]